MLVREQVSFLPAIQAKQIDDIFLICQYLTMIAPLSQIVATHAANMALAIAAHAADTLFSIVHSICCIEQFHLASKW